MELAAAFFGIPVYAAAGIISPYLFFALGLMVAGKLGLYRNMSRSHMYWSGLIACLLVPGMLAVGSVVEIEEETRYGYLESVFKFTIFCGTLMVYGSAAPELFEAIRNRIVKSATSEHG